MTQELSDGWMDDVSQAVLHEFLEPDSREGGNGRHDGVEGSKTWFPFLDV